MEYYTDQYETEEERKKREAEQAAQAAATGTFSQTLGNAVVQAGQNFVNNVANAPANFANNVQRGLTNIANAPAYFANNVQRMTTTGTAPGQEQRFPPAGPVAPSTVNYGLSTGQEQPGLRYGNVQAAAPVAPVAPQQTEIGRAHV